LPLLLVVSFATILLIESARWRLFLLLLVDLVATYTGFGLLLGWITPIVILLQWWRGEVRRSAALLAITGALAISASFFYDYRVPWYTATGTCLRNGSSPWEHLAFFVLVFARAFGATRIVSFPTVLGVVLAAALLWLVAMRSAQLVRPQLAKDQLREVTWVLGTFTLLFGVVASAGRSCLSAHAGLNSRYVPYVVPGLFALYLSHLGAGQRPDTRTRLLAYGFLIVYVALDVWPRSVDYREMNYFYAGKTRWIECVRRERDAVTCSREVGFYPDPTPADLSEKLATMAQEHLGFFAEP
jgi:hypothetical protein